MMMMMMMIRLTCDPHLSQNMYKNINVKTVERDKSGPVIPRSQFGGYEQTMVEVIFEEVIFEPGMK